MNVPTYGGSNSGSALKILQKDYAVNDLYRLRADTLWLMDTLFPTGFIYKVNRGPSESVTGDEPGQEMQGDRL